MKFQGKLASLQQVSSPNSQDNFQNNLLCQPVSGKISSEFCVFFVNFADLHEIHGSTTVRNIRSPVTCTCIVRSMTKLSAL